MTLLHDVRFGLRLLLRTPGFTAVAVLTLALGIGSNVAIVSMVKAVLLPPLPISPAGAAGPAPISGAEDRTGYRLDRLPRCRRLPRTEPDSRRLWRLPLRHAECCRRRPPRNALWRDRKYRPAAYTRDRSRMGRYFLADEDRPGRNRVIVLSDDLWRRRYAADPDIVGKTIQVAGAGAPGATGWVVIGVMPAGFNFPLSIPSAITPPRARWHSGSRSP